MHIDSKSQISGVSAIQVRDFLHQMGSAEWTYSDITKCLNLSSVCAEELVCELLRLGYIEPIPTHFDKRCYRKTLAGSTFAQASAARPLTRKTAQQRLDEFLKRVRAVNADDRFVYRVRKVLVFGSYLTERDRINDVDIAVELIYREKDPSKREAASDARIDEAYKAGRHFSTLVEQLSWPYKEVLLFLKSHSRAISLHTTEDNILKQAASRVIFEDERSDDVA